MRSGSAAMRVAMNKAVEVGIASGGSSASVSEEQFAGAEREALFLAHLHVGFLHLPNRRIFG
jgi:hypothetical protein